MVISIANPTTVNTDIMLSISPYEPGELVTSIYDATGKKVYELTTVIKNRDAVMLTLKKPVSAKGIYLVKNILNNKFIETRKIVVE